MLDINRPIPGGRVPSLKVGIVGGPCWRLVDQKPKHFTLLVFYRGLHCPVCRDQLRDYEQNFEAFHRRGVSVVAVSMDGRERAERTAEEWGIDHLTIGYGLSLETARAWGLYISSGRGLSKTGVEEPPLFAEPGLFLIRPDNTLYFSSTQSMPFARPRTEDLLHAVDYVVANDYPARGDIVDAPRLAAE